MFRRVLTTAAIALTICGLAAVPAHADPEDGQGCAGLPDFPAAYVCVISVTPAAALPTVTTSSIPVTVPRVCYVADCTDPTTVQVPVPGATLSSGNIAVLWYQGVYYPIGAGTGGVLTPIVNKVTTDATAAVNGAVTTVSGIVASTLLLVTNEVNDALDLVPTTDEINLLIQNLYETRVAPVVALANQIVEETPDAVLEAVRREVIEPFLEIWEPIREEIQNFDAGEAIQELVDRLQPTLDRLAVVIETAVDNLRESIIL